MEVRKALAALGLGSREHAWLENSEERRQARPLVRDTFRPLFGLGSWLRPSLQILPATRTWSMSTRTDKLDKELESWRGFPHVLRRDDRDAWDRMVKETRELFGEAIERSGKPFATEPFFMALLLLQQKMIEQLISELRAAGQDVSAISETTATLDVGDRWNGGVIGDHSTGT